MVDLHLHSTASDGSFSPQELVQLASKLQLKAIAITDHDSVDGITPALRAGRKHAKLEVIPAVELSSVLKNRDVHFLGYFINHKSVWLEDCLSKLRQSRLERAAKMVKSLRKGGFDIVIKDVLEEAGKGSVGRSHVAKVMLKKGQIDSINEAFNKYIGRDRPCYVEKYSYPPEEVISIIKKIGGIAVLAHPGLSLVDEEIPQFIKCGIKGIEVLHSEHSKEDISRYSRLADKLGLIKTGGSDCHGLESARGVLIGSMKVPDCYYEQLKAEWESSR